MMKKAKNFIVIILVITILFSTQISTFAVNIYWDDTPYIYELNPYSDDWSNYELKSDIVDKLQIPLEKIQTISTEALLQTVIDYPYILDYNFFNNPQDAYTVFYNDFNGFRELLSRSDLTKVLIDAYETSEVLSSKQYNLIKNSESEENVDIPKLFFQTSTLEFLIICDEIYNGTFSKQQQKNISVIMETKVKDRNSSSIYSQSANIYSYYKTKKLNPIAENELNAYTVSYVKTPNGSSVKTYYNQTPELTAAEIKELYEYVLKRYPDAEYLSPATVKYNCHSYAWYSRTTTNKHWMPDPSLYMSDGSYHRSATSARSGMKAFWVTGGHSGVVTLITFSGGTNTYYVTSKWGKCGLYQHPITNCPYSGAIHFYSAT